jgi:hypothetical protein
MVSPGTSNPRDYDPPETAIVESMLVRLGDLQHRRLFFERLQNPWWVRALDDVGAFNHVPSQQEDEADLRFRPWPEGGYLARMAGSVPEDVANVFLRLGATPNPYVARLVAQAAANMPAAVAVRLAKLVGGYLQEPWAHYLDPLDVVGLIKLLAEGNELRAASRLAAHAYRPRAAPDADAVGYRSRVSAGLERYWYAETLPQVVQALTSLGPSLARTLRAWLEQYQLLSGSFSESSGSDTSIIWRPSISPHEQNQGLEEIGDVLVDALRDVIPRVAPTEGDALPLLREFFTSQQGLIRRVAIHALAASDFPEASEASVTLAYEWLTSAEVLQADFRREYAQLARRFLPGLDAARATAWSDLVLGGPPWSQDRLERIATFGRFESESTDETVQRYQRVWRHGLLSAIGQDALPSRAREALVALDAEDGEYPHAEFPSYTSTWVGDRSPVEVEELAGWDVEELILFLNSWQPEGRSFAGPEATRDGLSGVLRAAVRANPQKWSEHAPEFRRTSAVFVRAVVHGLQEAVREGGAVAWPSVLDLAQFCVDQQDAMEAATDGWDDEVRWRWVHRGVVDLLQAGIEADASVQVPDALLGRVRQLLEPLTQAAEPTPEYEAQYGGSNMDPLSLSLNTLRPAATRAVLRLVGRILEPIRTEADARSAQYAGAAESPVAAAALASLESRLGAERDPSLAMAAVFGEALARLAWLDRGWLDEKLPVLLDDSAPAYRDVVVSTALATYRAPSVLVKLLQPWIEPWLRRAVQGQSVLGWRAHRDAIQLWADHLTILYGHGQVEYDDVVMQQFCTVASASDIGTGLGHLGWLLMRADDVPEPFLRRAADLWDRRMSEVQSGRAGLEELSGFGWWVESGKFSTEWWLPRLRVAATSPTFEPHGQMGQRLADAAPLYPAEAVEVLASLLASRSEPYRRFGLIQKAPDVLAVALDVGDEAAQLAAQNLMDDLGREGHLDILELVNGRRRGGSR